MKILQKLLFLLFVTTIVTSCSSDDDNTSSFDLTVENFSGVYSVTLLNSNDVETFTTDGETTTNTFNSEGSDFNLIWTFTPTGEITLTGSYTITDTGIEDGEAFTFTDTVILNESGTYVLDVVNQTVLLSFDGEDDDEAQLFDIQIFNENTIQLFSEETFTSDEFTGVFTVEVGLSR